MAICIWWKKKVILHLCHLFVQKKHAEGKVYQSSGLQSQLTVWAVNYLLTFTLLNGCSARFCALNPRMVPWKLWTPGCHQLFRMLRKKRTLRDIWNWKKIAGMHHSWIRAPFHSRKTVWCQFSFFLTKPAFLSSLFSWVYFSYFAYVANMIWWVWSIWASQSIEEMIAEGDCWFILLYFSTKNKREYKWLQGFPRWSSG